MTIRGAGALSRRNLLAGATATAVAGAGIWALWSREGHAESNPSPASGGTTSTGTPARITLPAPTGPHPVGVVTAHLVDEGRPEPWQSSAGAHPKSSAGVRELMVSVRYPARDTAGHRREPQFTTAEAEEFDQLNNFGELVPKGRVDWAATRTFAHRDAPPDRRGGPRPVLIASPGVLDPRGLGSALADELASRGYLVVSVDHTHEVSAVEFPEGRVETSVIPAEFQRAEEEGTIRNLLRKTLEVRVADARFVLDQVEALAAGRGQLPQRLAGLVNMAAVGAYGQSAGGFLAAQAMHDDLRFRAGADLDGVLAHVQDEKEPGHLSTVARDGLDRPFLLMGKDGDNHRTVPSWGALWDNGTGWLRDLTLVGAQHATYTDAVVMLPQVARHLGLPAEDIRARIGTVDPARAVAVQRAYLRAFFDRWLRGAGDRGLLDRPSSHYPEIRFVE